MGERELDTGEWRRRHRRQTLARGGSSALRSPLRERMRGASAVNERSLDPERRGKWPYVPGLAEAGVLHSPGLAQISVQVTKQHGPELFCIPWAIHAHTQGTKQTEYDRGIVLKHRLVDNFTFFYKVDKKGEAQRLWNRD
jgi:hypothetical protein